VRALLLVSFALVLTGCLQAGGSPQQDGPPPTSVGHEHAAFRMFAAGWEIGFAHPIFDYSQTRFAEAHLHFVGPERTIAQYVIHNEGRRRPTLEAFFASLEIEAQRDRVRLHEGVHGGAEFVNNETHAWQLWVDPCEDGPESWRREPNLFEHRPRDHERLPITFAPRIAVAYDLRVEFDEVPSHEELRSQLRGACGP
jgi:hypothetical protein